MEGEKREEEEEEIQEINKHHDYRSSVNPADEGLTDQFLSSTSLSSSLLISSIPNDLPEDRDKNGRRNKRDEEKIIDLNQGLHSSGDIKCEEAGKHTRHSCSSRSTPDQNFTAEIEGLNQALHNEDLLKREGGAERIPPHRSYYSDSCPGLNLPLEVEDLRVYHRRQSRALTAGPPEQTGEICREVAGDLKHADKRDKRKVQHLKNESSESRGNSTGPLFSPFPSLLPSPCLLPASGEHQGSASDFSQFSGKSRSPSSAGGSSCGGSAGGSSDNTLACHFVDCKSSNTSDTSDCIDKSSCDYYRSGSEVCYPRPCSSGDNPTGIQCSSVNNSSSCGTSANSQETVGDLFELPLQLQHSPLQTSGNQCESLPSRENTTNCLRVQSCDSITFTDTDPRSKLCKNLKHEPSDLCEYSVGSNSLSASSCVTGVTQDNRTKSYANFREHPATGKEITSAWIECDPCLESDQSQSGQFASCGACCGINDVEVSDIDRERLKADLRVSLSPCTGSVNKCNNDAKLWDVTPGFTCEHKDLSDHSGFLNNPDSSHTPVTESSEGETRNQADTHSKRGANCDRDGNEHCSRVSPFCSSSGCRSGIYLQRDNEIDTAQQSCRSPSVQPGFQVRATPPSLVTADCRYRQCLDQDSGDSFSYNCALTQSDRSRSGSGEINSFTRPTRGVLGLVEDGEISQIGKTGHCPELGSVGQTFARNGGVQILELDKFVQTLKEDQPCLVDEADQNGSASQALETYKPNQALKANYVGHIFRADCDNQFLVEDSAGINLNLEGHDKHREPNNVLEHPKTGCVLSSPIDSNCKDGVVHCGNENSRNSESIYEISLLSYARVGNLNNQLNKECVYTSSVSQGDLSSCSSSPVPSDSDTEDLTHSKSGYTSEKFSHLSVLGDEREENDTSPSSCTSSVRDDKPVDLDLCPSVHSSVPKRDGRPDLHTDHKDNLSVQTSVQQARASNPKSSTSEFPPHSTKPPSPTQSPTGGIPPHPRTPGPQTHGVDLSQEAASTNFCCREVDVRENCSEFHPPSRRRELETEDQRSSSSSSSLLRYGYSSQSDFTDSSDNHGGYSCRIQDWYTGE